MNETSARGRGLLMSRSGVVLLCFLAIIGFLLFTEHRAHVLGLLPYGILLLCPLLHMFHHGGHGGHGQHGSTSPDSGARDPSKVGPGGGQPHHHGGSES